MHADTPLADELTCRELVELVTDYLEGALAGPERARFEQHLADCEGCRDYLEQMRRTVRALGHPPREPLAATERERLLALFRGARRPPEAPAEGAGDP